MQMTTIKIKEKTRATLEKLKLHTKETYNDVIKRHENRAR